MTASFAHDPSCNTLHEGPSPCPPSREVRIENEHWTGVSKPFRIDVPSVPPHITCLADPQSELWIRNAANLWGHWVEDGKVSGWYSLVDVLTRFGSLVEHPDPRKAAST